MPDISQVPVTGRMLLANGLVPPQGVAQFTLSGPDTEGANALIPRKISATLMADGALPAGFTLWRNTSGARETVYAVSVVTVGEEVRLGWAALGAAASYEIGHLLSQGVPPPPAAVRVIDPLLARRLGAATRSPFINVVAGQSGAIGVGTGQNTIIDQSGGGQLVYSTFAGGGAGAMVTAAYGTVPLNRAPGGTSAVAAACYGNLLSGTGNRLRSERLVHPDRPIHHLAIGQSGLGIGGWIENPFTWFVAFEAAMAKMSADFGQTLQVDALHWDHGESAGTTAPPYNTNADYLGALRTLFAMLKASIYVSSETSFTVRQILTSAAYEPSDAPGTLVRPSYNRIMAQRAFAAEHPKVAFLSADDLGSAGTLAADVNHLPGLGLDAMGVRIADAFGNARAGGDAGGLVSPDGRPLLSYPLLTVSNATRYISVADLSAGHLMIRAANAILHLPLMPEDFQTIIKLDITSASVSNTVVNASPGTTIDGLLGFDASVSLPLGNYELSYNGQWHLVDENPRRGGTLDYVISPDPNTTTGLIVAKARGLTINSSAGCLIGLPSPEESADVTTIQRSLTTFGAATIGIACNSGTIEAGGTGYFVGDTITCALGGASGTAPTVTVTAVSGGVVTAVALTSPGCITSTARPASPAAQASTSGTGVGATVTLSYTTATIKGPRTSDDAYSYSLHTVGQIVDLKAMGGDWWVMHDSATVFLQTETSFAPVFGNSVPGDLSFSVAQVVTEAVAITTGKMRYVSVNMTFTPTWTVAPTGVWQISGLGAYRSLTGNGLECRLSDDFSLPTGGDDFVLVALNPAAGTVQFRTGRPDAALPVANMTKDSATSVRFYGWLVL